MKNSIAKNLRIETQAKKLLSKYSDQHLIIVHIAKRTMFSFQLLKVEFCGTGGGENEAGVQCAGISGNTESYPQRDTLICVLCCCQFIFLNLKNTALKICFTESELSYLTIACLSLSGGSWIPFYHI